MHETGMGAILDRKGNFREVYSPQCRAIIGICDQLVRNFKADIFLCFLRRPADMRGQDDVTHAPKRAFELLILACRLNREHVKRRTGQMTTFKRCSQVFDHNDIAACRIDQMRAGLHFADLNRGDHVFGLIIGRNMQ